MSIDYRILATSNDSPGFGNYELRMVVNTPTRTSLQGNNQGSSSQLLSPIFHHTNSNQTYELTDQSLRGSLAGNGDNRPLSKVAEC